MASLSKPKLLMCANPVYGHVMSLRIIARLLIVRGYDVTFLTGSDFKQRVEDIGATFVSLEGLADVTEERLRQIIEEFINADPPRTQDDLIRQGFIDVIPSQVEGIQKSLRNILKKSVDAKIILLYECTFRGALPGLLGAPGIRPLGHIGIGIIPVLLSSIDLKPSGNGLWPDSTPEGKARNLKLIRKDRERWAGSQKRFEEILKEMGATVPDMYNVDVIYRYADRFIQMCTPSIEFPRSDLPPGFRFAGGLSPGLDDSFTSKPDWWYDISINPKQKWIVAVSQGTIDTDITKLILPTIMACKDNHDIIVVAALGKKGATLPEATPVPDNLRVADWIPYDEMLQYADVFVTNGGYGSIQHGLSNGVPLIVAGTAAEKMHNAMRVEWAGVGVNLRTQTPTPEILKLAVLDVLETRKYKERAVEIQVEMQSYDPIEVVIENIEVVAEGE